MIKYFLGVIIFSIMVLIYYFFNPSNYILFPKCPFFALTGLKCPGCGSQRAIHSLLHLKISEAFEFNAFLLISLPIIFVLLFVEFYKLKFPMFYSKINNSCFIGVYFIVTIFWWLLRNMYNW